MRNQKLIDFRKSKNLTMEQMAERIGITRSMYIKLELGLRNPSIRTLQKFADTFDDFDIGIFLESNRTEHGVE